MALMVAGIWGIVELARLTGQRHTPELTVGFGCAVAAMFAAGTRVVRRVGDQIVVSALSGRQSVSALHAVLGIRMSGSGRYWQLALELMAYPDFERSAAVRVDSFQPSGIEPIMRAARRASTLLGLPHPILAAGLTDSAGRGPAATDSRERFDFRFDLLGRWAAADRWSKLLVLAGVTFGCWMILSSFLHAGAQLQLSCDQSWNVRNQVPTFSYTCQGHSVVDVDAGPGALDIWDPDRRCWIERKFNVPKKRRLLIDVDAALKAGRCAAVDWPAP